MACDTLSQHPDGTLLMVLHGEAGADVAHHVEGCAQCAADLRQLRQAEASLHAALYRATCPPSLQLGEFRSGLLPAQETTLLAAHVAVCPHCTQELRQLDAFLAQPDPAPAPSRLDPIVSHVRVLVARLVSGRDSLAQPGQAPAFAALRGDQDGPITYQAGDDRAILEIDEEPGQTGQHLMTGLLAGPTAASAMAHLWRGGVYIATTAVDSYGNFEFSNLDPGVYDLILAGPDVEIHVQSLSVR